MIRTDPTDGAVVIESLDGATPCAVATIRNYTLKSYEGRSAGESLLTCERVTCRIGLHKDWLSCLFIDSCPVVWL